MSLLIKALEQAAKDRDGTKNAGAPSSPLSSSPSTEPPLELAPLSRATRPVEPSSTTTGAAPERSSASPALETKNSPRPSATSNTALAQIDAQQQRARAAAVMQASESRR